MAIGVYDSGVGGLTVYKTLASALVDQDLIYLGDVARVPYGNRSPQTIVKYSEECGSFLKKNFDISALIVACNTVSSYALPELEKQLQIPVLGVIKPGAQNAVAVTENKKIIVLGTRATVNSRAYIKEIHACDSAVAVFQQPCPLFVPLVEEGLVEGEIAETVVRETLAEIKKTEADTVILGCTHYPVLKEQIQKQMPTAKIVDSCRYIIDDVKRLALPSGSGDRKILVTDNPPSFHLLKNLLVGDIAVQTVALS